MSWPTPQDYSEAVQNPQINFDDAELKSGGVAVSAMGLPIVASGSFASVYRVMCGSKLFAVRCFLKHIPDQHNRYDKISRYVMNDTLPYTVDFNYIQRGVLVHGKWYPILKMDWVDGVPLDTFVRENINLQDRLAKLSEQFKTMMLDLQTAGIAHGDLQHGNIMITKAGELRLVDYDGMFVPELEGLPSTELGHRNYQHPARDGYLFNARMDNFSAWSIYASLIALSLDPTLAPELEACDECLLFRQSDYRYPLNSKAFHVLEAHQNEQIRNIARTLRTLLSMQPTRIPCLSEEVKVPETLPAVNPVSTPSPFEPPPAVYHPSRVDVDESELDSRRRWPSLVQYMSSLTNPERNFIDPGMHNLVLVRHHGNIRAKGSDHGAVVRYHYADYEDTRKPDILVKVFLHADPLIEHRYRMLYTYLHGGAPNSGELQRHFANFVFINDGLRVGNAYYPIVRLERIKGPTLWEAVEIHRQDRIKMRELIGQFFTLMTLVESSGIIHGDIEPNNIIVSDDRMVLIDYDLTTVPNGRALASQLTGNKHHRHPSLSSHQASPNDNFAAWLIYYSLKIIQFYPVIWNIAGAKPGRLLFHADDLKRPHNSQVFRSLRGHFSEEVRKLESELSELLQTNPEEIRALSKRYQSPQILNAAKQEVLRLQPPPLWLEFLPFSVVSTVFTVLVSMVFFRVGLTVWATWTFIVGLGTSIIAFVLHFGALALTRIQKRIQRP